jgi:uncharacterized membrane protein (UPF0127 family)
MLAVLACAAAGCNPSQPIAPPAASTTTDPNIPTHAQAPLKTMKLWMGAEEVTAELALTGPQIRTGMMFRTNTVDNEGMLFVFTAPYRASFWMKNCPLPLSAAYIDPDGVILEVRRLEAQNTNSVVASSDRVQYVLEMKEGWFDRKGIAPGTLIKTEYGTLKETFMGRNQ